MGNGEFILYTTEDGRTSIKLRAEDSTVWLTQLEIASLFQTTKQNISLHIDNVLTEKEAEISVVKDYLTTASDGKSYRTKIYNLNMILAIGYRVRSFRGTQFRKWATTHLQEYLIKGFVMDDECLKDPKSWDYFDELLERIREIRASEKRFYQKIKEIYATAVDYEPKRDQAQIFFKKVQNKMLWATTGHTAAEVMCERADPKRANMGLTNWKGNHVLQQDVAVAKNYLNKTEINELNRIVTMYLDYAEDQIKHRQTMTMKDWEEKLDAFLAFNERDILNHLGKISAQVAKQLVSKHYAEFDAKRRSAKQIAADVEDIALLEQLQSIKDKKTNPIR